MLVLSLNNPQTCGARSVCSSLPSIAQLLLPITWRRQFQSREDDEARVCVFVFRGGMTEKDIKPPTPPGKTKKKKRKRKGGKCPCMCVCVPFKSNSKPQPKMYICQSWETSDIKCQRARWNTDKFPPYFFSPFIFFFLNRCCGFLFYYTRSAERDKKN